MEEGKVTIRFLNVELISKTVLPRPHDFEGKDFRFDFKADTQLSVEKKLAYTFLNIAISDSDNGPELSTFIIACVFEFPDFENIFLVKELSQYAIPAQIDLFLKSSAISTARGILYSELRGTYLQAAILPFINVAGLVAQPEDMVR